MREIGKGTPYRGRALPVYSVHTRGEAEILIATIARRQYDGRMLWPGFYDRHRDNPVEAIDTLRIAGKILHRLYEKLMPTGRR